MRWFLRLLLGIEQHSINHYNKLFGKAKGVPVLLGDNDKRHMIIRVLLYNAFISSIYSYKLRLFSVWLYIVEYAYNRNIRADLVYSTKISIPKTNGELRILRIPSTYKYYIAKIIYLDIKWELNLWLYNNGSVYDLIETTGMIQRHIKLNKANLNYVCLDVKKCFDNIKWKWTLSIIKELGLISIQYMRLLQEYFRATEYIWLIQGDALSRVFAEIVIIYIMKYMGYEIIGLYVDNILIRISKDKERLFLGWYNSESDVITYNNMTLRFHKILISRSMVCFCSFYIDSKYIYYERTIENTYWKDRLLRYHIRYLFE